MKYNMRKEFIFIHSWGIFKGKFFILNQKRTKFRL